MAIKRGVRASSARDLVDRFPCCLVPSVSCRHRADCCAQTRARVEPVSYRREVRCGVSKVGFRPLMLDTARLGNRKSATTTRPAQSDSVRPDRAALPIAALHTRDHASVCYPLPKTTHARSSIPSAVLLILSARTLKEPATVWHGACICRTCATRGCRSTYGMHFAPRRAVKEGRGPAYGKLRTILIDASLFVRSQEQGRKLNTRQNRTQRCKNTQTRASKTEITTEGPQKKGETMPTKSEVLIP